MRRIPEAELMDASAQAEAYAAADFSEPNNAFIQQLLSITASLNHLSILDIGCGPGDICLQLARRFPQAKITGIDGSAAMLDIARRSQASRHSNLHFIQQLLSDRSLPKNHYDIIISNSLLHHLHEPDQLWQTIKHCGKKHCDILVMDLFRPDSISDAKSLLQEQLHDAPEILKSDFYNSLLAAFTPREVQFQLLKASLSPLCVIVSSNRHMQISGRLTS